MWFCKYPCFWCLAELERDNIYISPLSVLLGLPANIILAWQNKKYLIKKLWLPASVLILLGSILGVFLLKNMELNIIKGFFGLAILFLSIDMLIRELSKNKKEIKESKVLFVINSLLSGLLYGLFSIGALLAIYLSKTCKDNATFKANLCLIFVIENSFRIIIYALTGIINFVKLKQPFFLFPISLIGLYLGRKFSLMFNEKTVKLLIICFLIFSGIFITINSFF